MGRPTKLDDLKAKRIVDAVAEGLPRDTAAKLARIAPSTLYSWLSRGEDGEAPYAELLERVKEAEAQGEQELVKRIRSASVETWQAAAWLLERRRPEAYALRREVVPEVEALKTKVDDATMASIVAAWQSRKAG